MFGNDENDQKNNDDGNSTKIDVSLGQSVGSSNDSSDNNGQSSSSNGPSPDEFDDEPSSSPSSSSSSASSDDSHDEVSSPPVPGNSDLLELKKEALQSLSPLVGHLDQTPEEKFRTTMMMIQATDNQDLVKAAYEAANDIKDEKVRAQALLDVVNEINYFTQPKDNKD